MHRIVSLITPLFDLINRELYLDTQNVYYVEQAMHAHLCNSTYQMAAFMLHAVSHAQSGKCLPMHIIKRLTLTFRCKI